MKVLELSQQILDNQSNFSNNTIVATKDHLAFHIHQNTCILYLLTHSTLAYSNQQLRVITKQNFFSKPQYRHITIYTTYFRFIFVFFSITPSQYDTICWRIFLRFHCNFITFNISLFMTGSSIKPFPSYCDV